MNNRPKTIICDIDGTVLYHYGEGLDGQMLKDVRILPGTIEKFREWDSLGYNIVLITGRKESLRSVTLKQLKSVGLYFDHLIMGIGGGNRILINDMKPDSNEDTASAVNILRNSGISQVKI
jgi:hypothetical protein